MVEKRKLSIREKAGYVPAFLSIGGAAISAPITAPFRGSNGADTYKHHVANAIIRKFNSSLSSIQSQYFQPSFRETYLKWCKSRGLRSEVVTTATSLEGFWMGDKDKASNIVIYYHGGGFAIDGSVGHLDFWAGVRDELSQHDISTAFFFVEYTLTPHAIYPTQLDESVRAVQYVVEELNRSPSDIILSGDSAGGNLAASVLLHLSSHPCPEITPFTIKENLKALALMAPWVSLGITWPSFTINKNRDYIEAPVEGRWSDEYLLSHPHDAWTDPATAPAEWWKDVKADYVFATVGSSEALLDGIHEWVDRYKSVNPNIELAIGQHEVHIAPIVWPMFGDKHETEQGAAIKQWMKQNLARTVTTDTGGKASTVDEAVDADRSS